MVILHKLMKRTVLDANHLRKKSELFGVDLYFAIYQMSLNISLMGNLKAKDSKEIIPYAPDYPQVFNYLGISRNSDGL